MKTYKNDIIWNYVGTIFSLGSNFILLPFILIYLNPDNIGIWYIFLSLNGVVTLLNFGFAPSFARNIAYAWGGATTIIKVGGEKTDNKEVNVILLKKIIKSSQFIYFCISLIAIILLLSVGTNYIKIISIDLIGNNHMISWYIFVFAIYINLLFGYYGVFLRGIGAISKLNKSIITSRLIQLIVTITLLYFGYSLISLSIGLLFQAIIKATMSRYLFSKHYNIGTRIRNVKVNIKVQDYIHILKAIWHNAWRDGIVSLSKYFSTQASVIIMSMYFTLTQTGYYALSLQVVTAVATVSGVIYTTFQPKLQIAFIRDDLNKSRTLMSFAMIAYSTIYILGISAIILLLPYVSKIKPDFKISIGIFIAISFYEYLYSRHLYYASYISSTNRVPYMLPFIISSVSGLLLTIIIINLFDIGIWGLILSQIVVQFLYNNWKWPRYVKKQLGLTNFDMIRITIDEIRNVIFRKQV